MYNLDKLANIPQETFRLATALVQPISALNLDSRTYNCLARWGLETVGDICDMYVKGQLSKVRNFGQKSMYELEHRLAAYLSSYMNEDEDLPFA